MSGCATPQAWRCHPSRDVQVDAVRPVLRVGTLDGVELSVPLAVPPVVWLHLQRWFLSVHQDGVVAVLLADQRASAAA